jgi:probable rRNA maturation factor
VTDGHGRAASAPGLGAWLARVAPPSAHGELAIALVSDARIQALNRRYRRKNYPTDVLSFPSEQQTANHASRASRLASRASRLAPHASRLAPRPLGDIVIAMGVARRQARAAGHSYAAELKILALHGLLHLLGYDHERPGDRARMERIERRLRAKGGLRAGLIERATRHA